MQVTLEKAFGFEAAHRLPKVPEGHKCARLHGHSYRFSVLVRGPVDPERGWLMDYATLADIVSPLVQQELDHRYLNEVPGLENPTAEHVAAWIWEQLGGADLPLEEIRLYETPNCYVVYRGA